MSRNKRLLMAAAGAASAAIAFAMAPAVAQAVTPALPSCLGASCTGHPASSYTCSQDAKVVYSVEIYIGTTDVGNLELKWSPSCHATWARVIGRVSSAGWAGIVSSNPNITVPECQFQTSGNTGCNTNMIDDLSPLTSYAEADIQIYHADAMGYTDSW